MAKRKGKVSKRKMNEMREDIAKGRSPMGYGDVGSNKGDVVMTPPDRGTKRGDGSDDAKSTVKKGLGRGNF